jgi:uncharacterized protein Smg (DUF494 family)
MKRDNCFEIVLFLAERFSGIYPQKWELDEAHRFLKEMGYENGEISRAISWFFLQAEPDGSPIPSAPLQKTVKGFRILSPQEMNLLTPDAYGHLLELLKIGVIDDDNLEEVMDRAMTLGQEVIDREDMTKIVNKVLHDVSDEDAKRGR